MSIVSTDSVITDLFNNIHQMLNNYTDQAFHALSSALAAPLGVAISLYIVLMGFSISQGFVEMKMKELVSASLKMAVVYTAAMNWEWVNEYFIALISSVVTDVSNVMVSVGDGDITASLHGGISDGLQIALNRIANLAQDYSSTGSMTNIIPYFYATLIAVLGAIVVVIASAEIIVATILMALFFGLTPLMVTFYLFSPTKSFFERWLGGVTGEGMVIIFVSAMVGMVLVMIGWVFPADLPDKSSLNLTTIIAPVIVCLLSIFLLLKAASMGRSIGSGVSGGSGLASMMMVAGGTIFASKIAMSAAKKMKNMVGGKSDNKNNDKKDSTRKQGQVARAARSRIRNKSDNQEGK